MDPELLDGASVLPFLAAEHTTSVNSLAPAFGQLNRDGMFPVEGLDTTYVAVTMDGGVIRALPTTEGGRPSTIARHEKGKEFIFRIPNISHEDSIMADDIRKFFALAKRSRVPEETLAKLIEARHQKNRRKFEITLELMRMSSLQGKIVDGAGTVLYDLFKVFDVTEQIVYFDLDNANSDIRDKINQVMALIDDGNTDEVVDGYEARVDPVFFSKLVGHPKFEKYYLNTPSALQLFTEMRRQPDGNTRQRVFDAGGLNLREYRNKITMWDNSQRQLILTGEGVAYPTGTVDTHKTYAAPPLDIRALDGSTAEADDLIHVTTEIMKHGAGEEWKYQMNALPIWARPNLRITLKPGAAPG